VTDRAQLLDEPGPAVGRGAIGGLRERDDRRRLGRETTRPRVRRVVAVPRHPVIAILVTAASLRLSML
jgi:hypothetical protein